MVSASKAKRRRLSVLVAGAAMVCSTLTFSMPAAYCADNSGGESKPVQPQADTQTQEPSSQAPANSVPQEQPTDPWTQLTTKNFVHKPISSTAKFGDRIAVFGDDEVKLYDEAENTISPLAVSDLSEVVWVGEDSSTNDVYALGKTLLHNGKKKVVLAKKSGDTWTNLTLPESTDAAKGNHPHLLVGGGQVLFLTTERCSHLEDGKWKTVNLSKGCVSGDDSSKVVIANGEMFSAVNLGDSGYVDRIDIKSGGFKRVFTTKAQGVTDIGIDDSGKLWIACGREDGENKQGSLYMYDTHNAHLKCVALAANGPENDDKKSKNWDLQPTAFQAIIVDPDGTVLLATRDLGVLRYSNEKWTRITSEWHPITVSTMHKSKSGSVVISCPDRGLIVLNPDNGKLNFLVLN